MFEALPKATVSPNVVSYNATISAFEKGSQLKEALDLFEAMPKATMSSATMQPSVLARREVNANKH